MVRRGRSIFDFPIENGFVAFGVLWGIVAGVALLNFYPHDGRAESLAPVNLSNAIGFLSTSIVAGALIGFYLDYKVKNS